MKLSAQGRIAIAVVLLLVRAAPGGTQGGDGYRVVVNAANPATSLTAKEVSDVFLGKAARWPDGTVVKPVDQSTVSPVRVTFTREVHGKKVDAIVNYWQQMIFSGRGVPPPAKANDQDVVGYVKANPGGIGYVAQETSVSGVKMILIKP
jgi:ABC-type phosphate transport system substrate-binding protein